MSAVISDPVINKHIDKDAGTDNIFRWGVASAAAFVMFILLAAALAMLWGGRLAFETFGWRFFTNTEWDAVGKNFGAAVPIIGTLVSSAIAMVIAVPISFGIAFY